MQSLEDMNNLNKPMEEKRVDVQKQMFIESMQLNGKETLKSLKMQG